MVQKEAKRFCLRVLEFEVYIHWKRKGTVEKNAGWNRQAAEVNGDVE
jgi:predicted transcriptional regulator